MKEKNIKGFTLISAGRLARLSPSQWRSSDIKAQPLRGFTLIELLVVLAIIGILTAIGIVAFTAAQVRARDSQRKSDLRTISSALERYRTKLGTYPDSSSSGDCGSVGLETWFCSNTTRPAPWITGLDQTYIKLLPKDPKNTDGNSCAVGTPALTYSYKSSQSAGTPAASRTYTLTARLENTNDKDESPTYPDCFVLKSP